MKDNVARLTKHCSAPPEVVYDSIADLRAHPAWGGAKQRIGFGLLSLDAPDGPAAAGTTFSSTGAMPMSLRSWHDRSSVTVAQRPGAFEFVTHASLRRSRRPMEATFRHRYDIAPAPGGSTVTYTFTQLDVSHPILRWSLPVVRAITWRVGIPFDAKPGFRNLLAIAGRHANLPGVSPPISSIDGKGSFRSVKRTAGP